MIQITCPGCQSRIQTTDENAGKKVRCQKCKTILKVPVPAATVRAAIDSPPVPKDGEPPQKRHTNSLDRQEKLDTDEYFAGLKVQVPTSADKLGAFKGAFKSNALRQARLMVLGIALALAGPGMFIAALVIGVEMESPAISVLICIAISGFGILVAVGAHTGMQTEVGLFEKGILHISSKMAKVILWTDVAKLWQDLAENYSNGVHIGTSHVYTIEIKVGKEFRLDDALVHIGALGEAMQQAVSRVQLPETIAAFERGEKIEFGPVTVGEDGITHEEALLQWDELEAMKLKKGVLVVQKRGKWLDWGKVKVQDIPNLYTFLGLIEHVLKNG